MLIVDRRLNPGSKSLENRQRFLRRAKALVQGAVKKTSEGRDIKDILESGHSQTFAGSDGASGLPSILLQKSKIGRHPKSRAPRGAPRRNMSLMSVQGLLGHWATSKLGPFIPQQRTCSD